ncbi:MAG: WbqC-like protein [Parcubacteria group bacterium GW2011_GWC2_42_12]|uniref:WbqC-like protein n=1 Tax=Candidatus Falkowbacteria bacterium RIFCSPHIGHO2_02_FULL_42_9 TaxID=1797986 RepID=A0A1F5S9U2_9BACT|nr:MAG: WbqC-like protein [Parcubacteria group bacterium GW2011_GWC2_42_12]OGF23475.1 MAG: hypothetical protein A3D45_01120 [Candidatus Falkowbacteria bacterium RIFCSPHIGHO2_02_FULL_42_9]
MKKKTVAIMQPSYLPWVGFFELIYRADVFVVYDTVQFDKNGWRNRNRIKTANGSLWLTVPVKASGRPKLCEAVIDNSKKWRKQHLRSIELNYGKCQYFNDYFPQLEKILNSDWQYLNDLNLALIKYFLAVLDLTGKEFIISSKLDEYESMAGLDKVGRLIELCKFFKADVFYEPMGGKCYLEIEKKRFEQANIQLVFQNIESQPYNQPFGNFIPNLSIIDLLFSLGPSAREAMVKSGANVII